MLLVGWAMAVSVSVHYLAHVLAGGGLSTGPRSVVPCEVGRWLEEHLPRARRLVLEGAGHAPFWDEPTSFNRALRELAGES